MISFVMPAMIAGSPAPRFWCSGMNQFQHSEAFGRLGLVRIGDDEALRLGALVHARPHREVVSILRAAVQHHQQPAPAFGQAPRNVELVVSAPGGAGEGPAQELSAVRHLDNLCRSGDFQRIEVEARQSQVAMRRDHLAHAPRPQRGARRQRQFRCNACAILGDVRRFRLHDLGREIDDPAFDRPHGPCRRGRRRGLVSAGQRALNDPRGLHELLGLNQSHRRAHAVSKVHVHCLNPYASVSRRQLMRSASAALISLLACSAPSTVIDSMVAAASAGVTSGAKLVSPSTLMCSFSPAAFTASRSARV